MLSRCRASLGGLQAASSVKEALQASELLPCHSGLALDGTPPQAFFCDHRFHALQASEVPPRRCDLPPGSASAR